MYRALQLVITAALTVALVSLGFISVDSNQTPREKGEVMTAEIETRSVITAETVGELHKIGVIRTDAEMASASFSPDGHLLATADYGGAVKLWNTSTLEESLTVKPSGSMVWGVSFSPDSVLLAYWGLEGLHLWDIVSGKVVKTIDTHGDYASVAAFSIDGRVLVTGSLDGVIEVWESATGKRRAAVEVLDGATISLEYSPDGRFLAVGGAAGDTRILLLDAETLEERLSLVGQKTDVHAICFRPDMEVLTSVGPRGVVITWDIDLAEPSTAVDDCPGNLFAADYSPDGSLFVVADDLGLVRIMDGMSGEEVHGLEHSGNGHVAAFSPDGTVLATTGAKNEVVIWALE